jgi:hypothetical protein
MESDALQGVAQLHSLRKLSMNWCSGVTEEMLRTFLETTLQGPALSVAVNRCRGLTEEAAQAVHEGVVRLRGGRDAPRWGDPHQQIFGD